MDRKEKENLVADMKERLQNAQAAFLVDYQGLDVETLNRLRNELRQTGSEFQVVKNRLVKFACQDTETESLREHFVGPCALAIAHDDVVAPAKVLVDFSKTQKSIGYRTRIGNRGYQKAGRTSRTRCASRSDFVGHERSPHVFCACPERRCCQSS